MKLPGRRDRTRRWLLQLHGRPVRARFLSFRRRTSPPSGISSGIHVSIAAPAMAGATIDRHDGEGTTRARRAAAQVLFASRRRSTRCCRRPGERPCDDRRVLYAGTPTGPSGTRSSPSRPRCSRRTAVASTCRRQSLWCAATDRNPSNRSFAAAGTTVYRRCRSTLARTRIRSFDPLCDGDYRHRAQLADVGMHRRASRPKPPTPGLGQGSASTSSACCHCPRRTWRRLVALQRRRALRDAGHGQHQ